MTKLAEYYVWLFFIIIQALVYYSLEALRGVQGFVIDKQNGAPLAGVQLWIKDREARQFNTSKIGEFRRILLDGNYILMVND